MMREEIALKVEQPGVMCGVLSFQLTVLKILYPVFVKTINLKLSHLPF